MYDVGSRLTPQRPRPYARLQTQHTVASTRLGDHPGRSPAPVIHRFTVIDMARYQPIYNIYNNINDYTKL